MPHIDFASILSSALTPITLISGVGLLLMAMSAATRKLATASEKIFASKVVHLTLIRESKNV